MIVTSNVNIGYKMILEMKEKLLIILEKRKDIRNYGTLSTH